MHIYSKKDLLLYVLNGVTSVQNMWGFEGWLTWLGFPNTMALKQHIEDGNFGPQIWTSGPILEGAKKTHPFMSSFTTMDAARQEVIRQKQAGYDFIKPYDNLSKDVYLAILAEAKKQGLPVKGHVPFAISLDTAVEAGVKQIEHLTGWLNPDTTEILPPMETRKRLAKKMADRSVAVCPSFIVFRRVVSEQQAQQFANLPGSNTLNAMARFFERMGAKSMRSHVTMDIAAYPKKLALAQNQTLAMLNEAGVNIVACTDAGNPFVYPGYSLHEELSLMNKADMSIVEVLQSATINAAQGLGVNDRGLIKPGFIADMVLLNANPLESIENIKAIEGVFVRGRWFSSDRLQALSSE